MQIDRDAFRKTFSRFRELMAAYSGAPFTDLHEGLAGVWENYKPKLREVALRKLNTDSWESTTIGTGHILTCAIAAIEIQDSRPGGIVNNLLYWQNRYGHASREHRGLLDAQQDANARRAIEAVLFELYRGNADEAVLFDRLSEVTGRKYTLSAYLYFLKDVNRFMPIQPTGFDRAFADLGLNFTTLRNCDWENYRTFNEILESLRAPLGEFGNLKNVSLLDAHSFAWILATLLKRMPDGAPQSTEKKKDDGRILGALERAITAMRYSILATAAQSRGQLVNRNVQMKVKDLGFDSDRTLDDYLRERMMIQGGRCALTGIKFQLPGEPGADKNLLPSPDRIDSNGHYAPGNLQVVCQFANFWKRDTKNEEFMRLLALVRDGADRDEM
jgi:hypothetical protein